MQVFFEILYKNFVTYFPKTFAVCKESFDIISSNFAIKRSHRKLVVVIYVPLFVLRSFKRIECMHCIKIFVILALRTLYFTIVTRSFCVMMRSDLSSNDFISYFPAVNILTIDLVAYNCFSYTVFKEYSIIA